MEKRDSFLNQKSSQSPFSKRRMSPKIRGLLRRCVPCNDGGMDSRLRGNDPSEVGLHEAGIKGSGNEPSEARIHGVSIRKTTFKLILS